MLAGLLLCAALSGCAAGNPAGRTDAAGHAAVPVYRAAGLIEFPTWKRIRDAERLESSFAEAGLRRWPPERALAWKALRERLAPAPFQERITRVNAFFNRFPHREDQDVWGVAEYWARPFEFANHGGDCEDAAIAKYYALRDLGLEADALKLAGVWSASAGQGHVVVIAWDGREWWALDNQDTKPVPWRLSPYHRTAKYFANEEMLRIKDADER